MDPGPMARLTASRTVCAALLAVGLFHVPLGAGAQTAGKVQRVGVIVFSGYHDAIVEGLRQGLRELGLEEGKQLVLDVREIKDVKAAEATAANLEQGKADLIFAVTSPVALATKRATARVPIVFFGGVDPVAAGLLASFAKPGGRVTGVHSQSSALIAKRLEILKEMVPKLSRVLTFYNPGDLVGEENAKLSREAARQLRLQLIERHVSSVDELRRSLAELKPREADAYFHTPNALVTSQALLIIETAKAKKLPTMFHEENLVDKGALASYGASYREVGRISAKYVQRILTGTDPKDLPVENYDKVEFILNLRTARQIGLTIPQSIRLRANRVIE